MQFSINKAKTAAVITIALLMASIALMAMPIQPVQAQLSGAIGTTSSDIYGYPKLGPLPAGVTPQYTVDMIASLSFEPNPIGVGQQILVNVWVEPGAPNWMYMQGYKVTIQKPDGTTEVIGPFNSYLGDLTAWFEYVVDQVGTWKFKFESPGTYIPAGQYVPNPGTFPQVNPNFTIGASIYYKPCSTDWQELTVQQEWINSWPSVPLPTDYWTRPISIENREWWPIAGNYPWTGAYYYPNGRVLYASNYKYTAYVQAPNTAHIVWRRQGAISGLIGGEQYQYSTYTGSGNPNIIYAGRCYQTVTKPMSTLINGTYRMQPTSVWQCYDLRTGQVYWDLTDVTAPTAILYETPQIRPNIALGQAGSGVTVYLVAISGGRLLKYTPLTGAVSLNISLPSYITSGTIYNNEWVYTVQTINATAGNYRLINWTMRGTSTNFTARIGTNITWPIQTYSAPFQVEAPTTVFDYDAGVVVTAGRGFGPPQGLGVTGTGYASSFCFGHNITAADLLTGAVFYNIGDNETLVQTAISYSNSIVNRGKFATSTVGRQWVCRDARTGKILWRSEKTGYPWGCWFPYNTASYDFNETKSAIITSTYDGVYAIDWDNGKILWHYYAPMPPFESPYGGEPFFTGVTIADGKVYAYGGEHTTTQPITRGWHFHCINATTGELIWKMTGAMSPGAMADGYLTASNPNDGYMYVFGKGKSQTTVSTPDTVVAMGTGVVIKGTVMDQSPGDQGSWFNPTAPLDSPTKPGTLPCVSAASMQTQMEYLYMQHPIDGLYHNETLTGVPVILTAIGSDGTVIDIGTTTTNGYYGTFAYAWTPPKEDTYTIMASFAGDDSYGSSSAATGLSVGPAPASPTPTPTPPEAAPDNTPMYFAISTILIILAIAIATVLLLRRRS
jgi:hypothetical protein